MLQIPIREFSPSYPLARVLRHSSRLDTAPSGTGTIQRHHTECGTFIVLMEDLHGYP